MAAQRWTADKNIQFIHQYKRHPVLWDPRHPKYKTKKAREVAYRHIMATMQMDSIKDVIAKIRILRNTHNNEHWKTKKSLAFDEPYVSKIPWLSHLDFIRNFDDVCPDYSGEHSEDVQQKEDKEEVYLDEPAVEFVQLSNPEDIVMVKTEVIDEEEAKPPPKRPRLQIFNDDSDNSSVCTYSHPEPQIRYTQTQPREDCFDTFGKYVSSMLRMMPKQKAMEMQPKIVTLLTSVNFDSVEEHVSQSDET